VAQSAAAMLELLRGLEQEVGTLQETVRSGATRLGKDLSSVQSKLEELPEPPSAAPEQELEVEETTIVATETEEPVAAVEPAEGHEAPVAVVEAPADDEEEAGAAEESEEDLEGARLIALNMALN